MEKKTLKKAALFLSILLLIVSAAYYSRIERTAEAGNLELDEEAATIRAIKKTMPAVLSITVYDWEEFSIVDMNGGGKTVSRDRVEVGSGTGFLVSADGLIITNKHVVITGDEKDAEYRITLNNGKKYYAQLIGKDPLNDFAILKIFDKNLPYVELGNSDKLEVGSTVVAIGNVLGIYPNSVTKGIVSGLSRNLTAGDRLGNPERLNNVIQTDAGINQGNSGGPLVDLSGRVVGINVASDKFGNNIGFAIPINDAYPVIKSAKEIGRIVRTKLGVRSIILDEEIAREQGIKRSAGAMIVKGENNEPAVLKDSPANLAGLEEGDIIFEIDSVKIDEKTTLSKIIQSRRPGDKIGMKIDRGGKIMIKIAELGEF